MTKEESSFKDPLSDAGTDIQPRLIGPAGGIAIVAGSMLGIGIFLTPSQVISHLPGVWMYMLVWILGGAIAFSGAVAYAELGTRFPKAGGDYVFLDEAYGRSLSFAAGWLLFAGVFCGSVATMAVPLAEFQIPVLLKPWADFDPQHLLFRAGIIEITAARAIGAVLVLTLTVLNILGTRLSANTQILLTLIPVALLALAALYLLVTTSPGAVTSVEPGSFSLTAAGRAVLAVYFAYAGWNAIAYVGGEIKNPARLVPVSLLGGTALITLLYLLLAGTFLYVLGQQGLAGAVEAGTATAHEAGGQRAAMAVTGLIAVALLGSLNGTVLAAGRVGWAMARRGALFQGMGTLNTRFQTPDRALWFTALLSVLLIATGTFEVLLELTSLAMFLMSTLTVGALFLIRKREGNNAPYKAAGFPWLPLFFVVVSLIVMTASLYRGLIGPDRMTLESLYPLMGLMLFAFLWATHRMSGKKKSET